MEPSSATFYRSDSRVTTPHLHSVCFQFPSSASIKPPSGRNLSPEPPSLWLLFSPFPLLLLCIQSHFSSPALCLVRSTPKNFRINALLSKKTASRSSRLTNLLRLSTVLKLIPLASTRRSSSANSTGLSSPGFHSCISSASSTDQASAMLRYGIFTFALAV